MQILHFSLDITFSSFQRQWKFWLIAIIIRYYVGYISKKHSSFNFPVIAGCLSRSILVDARPSMPGFVTDKEALSMNRWSVCSFKSGLLLIPWNTQILQTSSFSLQDPGYCFIEYMKKLCLSYQIPPLLSLECAEQVSKQSLTLLPSQYENICTLSDKLTPCKRIIDSVFKFCDRHMMSWSEWILQLGFISQQRSAPGSAATEKTEWLINSNGRVFSYFLLPKVLTSLSHHWGYMEGS